MIWDDDEDGAEVGRYEAEKKAGLPEVSRRPHTSPRATKLWVRCKLVQEVQMRQGMGKRKSAAQLRRELKLTVILPTVLLILREEGLYKGKRKGKEKKRDLREVKKLLPAFEKGGREIPGEHSSSCIPSIYTTICQNTSLQPATVLTGAVCIAYTR